MSIIHEFTKQPSETFVENITESVETIKSLSFSEKFTDKDTVISQIEQSGDLLLNYDERVIAFHSKLKNYLDFLGDIIKDSEMKQDAPNLVILKNSITRILTYLTYAIDEIAHEIERQAKDIFE